MNRRCSAIIPTISIGHNIVAKSHTSNIKIISHLLRPTRGGAAAVLIVFAVLLSVAAKAGLMGIPLAFI